MHFKKMLINFRKKVIVALLSIEWVDYVEEPMKCQALRTHFSSVVGGWRVLGGGWVVGLRWVVVGWVVFVDGWMVGGAVGRWVGGVHGGGVVGSGWVGGVVGMEKIVHLMKDLNYEHQCIFPLWGRVKLNFRNRYKKPNIYSMNSSRYQVFSSNSQKLSFWCKKKIITHPDGFV